jgi:nicotinate dehydrogenase subunit B
MIQGLGGALFESIQFESGRISNAHFSSYRVPRFKDVPEIEAILLDRKDIASAGAGETPIMAVAPAIGNAFFNATNLRLRKLPLHPELPLLG